MVDTPVLRVLAALPYAIVGTLTAFTLGSRWGSWPDLSIDIVLCVLVAVWMVAFRVFRLPWNVRPAVIAVFMTGMIVLTLLLVLRESWFGLLVIACFIYAYSIVIWPWQLLAVGAVAIVAGIAQGSDIDTTSSSGVVAVAAVIALNIIGMCGLSWILRLTHREFQRTGMEAERHRLAHEIHDTLAQCLAGIVTQLQAAEDAHEDTARQKHTTTALELARSGLIEARSSMQALRPPVLEQVQLAEAIKNVSDTWSARSEIAVVCHMGGLSRPLHTDVEVALIRTVQECLVNIERHAHAHRVNVTLRYGTNCVLLEVRDDGNGFDLTLSHDQDTRDSGYGLTAMRERIEALAGTIMIDSRPSGGTTIRAEVPV